MMMYRKRCHEGEELGMQSVRRKVVRLEKGKCEVFNVPLSKSLFLCRCKKFLDKKRLFILIVNYEKRDLSQNILEFN